MKRYLFYFLVFLPGFSVILSGQNIIKVPFFENVKLQSGSKELVILVDEPRTDFARNFGNRIYTDSVFLEAVNETFYFEVDADAEKLFTPCGHDFYFYLKTGPNLRLIKTLNSDCMGERSQHIMGAFAINGRALIVDTLMSDSVKYTSVLDMYKDGAVLVGFSGRYGGSVETNFNNGIANYPTSFYGGQMEVILKAETPTLMSQLISDFFKEHRVDSVEYRLINWKIKSTSLDGIHISPGQRYYLKDLLVRELILTVRLDESLFYLFKGISIDGVYPENKWPLIIII